MARRPSEFWRGYDVYDQKRMGFVFDSDEAKRIGTRHDVTAKGGGNQGHEYGVMLPDAEKEVLIEYLKTLWERIAVLDEERRRSSCPCVAV